MEIVSPKLKKICLKEDSDRTYPYGKDVKHPVLCKFVIPECSIVMNQLAIPLYGLLDKPRP